MNVGRGLFRAWVVVSILWIGGAIFLPVASSVGAKYAPVVEVKKGYDPQEFSKIIDAPSPPNFYTYMHSPSGEKLNVEFSRLDKPPTNTTTRLIGFADGTELFIPGGYNETDKKYIAQQFWEQRWSHWLTTVKDVLTWAVLPCAALFFLGYALLWVGRGFRRA